VEKARDFVRVQAALLRTDRLEYTRAKWAAETRDGCVHELAEPLVLGVCRRAHGAGHARARVEAEQRFEELALCGDRLMHPREHVADVAQRVVRVQVDRPRACAACAPAGCQGAREGGEERGLARLREHSEGIAGQEWIGWKGWIEVSVGSDDRVTT